jgi:hypothetical protein
MPNCWKNVEIECKNILLKRTLFFEEKCENLCELVSRIMLRKSFQER